MAGRSFHFGASLILTLVFSLKLVSSQFLTPPAFNLAEGRNIYASATCGEGVSEPELFCKLTGATGDRGHRYLAAEPEPLIYQGQLCDHCNPDDVDHAHPPTHAIDGSQRWWQSPPLSRGLEYNSVNLTIDLGQEFHVAYFLIKMANSPRPGVWALERSVDYGKTWKAWQYFADTESDCYDFFGVPVTNKITRDDQVICTTEYSKIVPLEGGEIVVSLTNDRPSAKNFSYGATLQEWTTATNVRLRLLRTKTLLGHLMAVARQDPTVTRRYFYSIKDISIGGRCVCNGHADVCDKTDPDNQFRLLCRCQHNTCGAQCDQCCPGFVQKKWRKATADNINACEPCQCYGHADECIYDEDTDRLRLSIDIHGNYQGGGVCQNCSDNTEGINCERCVFGYYRPAGVPRNSTYACQRCNCDLRFSTGDCEDGDGTCKCRPEFTGIDCASCNKGYYGWPDCRPCDCNFNGTEGEVCEVGGGQCPCKYNYDGLNCDQCAFGFYGFPDCVDCGCNNVGSLSRRCNLESGQCQCRNNYGGRDCSVCEDGYYGFPACNYCDCDQTGTLPEICNKRDGFCMCKPNFGGQRCDQCAPGYYNYPNCIPCQCDTTGSRDNICSANGQCPCNVNYGGLTCNQCAPGYYRYPDCLSCSCDSYGSIGVSCDQVTGQCACRGNFKGLTCNDCAENYYNYPVCEECNCVPAGAVATPGLPLGGCGSHKTPGQLCECKSRVEGHICDVCKPGYWNLNINNPEGCEECGCHAPGTVSGDGICNPVSGQCQCKPRTTGRQCSQCVDGTYNLFEGNLFGCTDCDCDAGGALDNNCDKNTGQCNCRPRVNGRRCDKPLRTHFFPTLYQHQYELEDGRTPQNTAVRFGFDNSVFPGYSWRGYAILSRIQPEVVMDVDISKPTLYRLLYRYINPNPYDVKAEIQIKPQIESSVDVMQSSEIVFMSNSNPSLATASDAGNILSTFVLNPGRWSISIKTPEKVYLDYLVLLPQAYYEATVLQENVNQPCIIPDNGKLCLHFVYAKVEPVPIVRGEQGYTIVDNNRQRVQLYDNDAVLRALGTDRMGLINKDQFQVYYDIIIPNPGKYVLVVQYYAPNKDRQQLQVDVAAQDLRETGKLVFYRCDYSSLCRQVISDTMGRVAIYDVKSGYIRLILRGDENTDVAIDSIMAIPLDQWSYSYVEPKLKCIRKDGVCIPSRFRAPVGTIKVEVESSNEPSTNQPPEISDVSVTLVEANPGRKPTIRITVRLEKPGTFVFVVQYYQPYHTGFNVPVYIDVNGQIYQGSFFADYCPSVSGCRSVVKFQDTLDPNVIDMPYTDFDMVFNNTNGKLFWLDYLLAIPAFQYTSNVLDVQPIDKAGDFLKECAGENFDISPTSPSVKPFCRKALFSLTTDYNNGGIACDCNPEGSLSYSCTEFGGQCQCKQDVIGRRCSQCRTGYYGFPNCKPCNCPAGLCHPVTGACVCPARVTGKNCDVCLPRTFAYDRIIGCEDCNCDPSGVEGGILDCDINSGQCQCRQNVGGRRCEMCVAGFYNYPSCNQCNCDSRGTTSEICDQRLGQCLCKYNTDGPRCSTCQPGTFYLEERNAKGCTQCFCFGKTNRCSSSILRRSKVSSMSGWNITNIVSPSVQSSSETLSVDMRQGLADANEGSYWVAPDEYLGNKLTSYGGQLTYTMEYSTLGSGTYIEKADVKLVGKNLTIVHLFPSEVQPSTSVKVVIDMLEKNFVHDISGADVTREEFMQILAALDALHIRASYNTEMEQARLTNVQLDIASQDGTGDMAANVEQCECPPNYRGTSCEECADGYYKSMTGPYQGVCVPCNCNGHAATCDKDTGRCIACSGNTYGDNCEVCLPGYYGDPSEGPCRICACPLPMTSNNFATSCEVPVNGLPGDLLCTCKPGYVGDRCQSCAIGYYGDPTTPGEECRLCGCSGNIDLTDPRACDRYTGVCNLLMCQNNTGGDYCERCKDWFYGDALNRKDCRACTCDRCGSQTCNHQTGQCECKPNVEGPNCERCQAGFYGYDRCNGCESCDCDQASVSSQCDGTTGRCQCQPGAAGTKCERCENGYYNYTPRGCTKCDCEGDGAITCDVITGKCQCLPGVTGARCDRCFDRWVLIPDEGCRECGTCIHTLLDDIDIIDRDITVTIRNLQNISVGVLAVQRLNNISKEVAKLRPQVDNLNVSGDLSELKGIQDEVLLVQDKANKLEKESIDAKANADQIASEGKAVKEESVNIEDQVRDGAMAARDAVEFVQDVLQKIEDSIDVQNIDSLIQRAEAILRTIQLRDFSENNETAGNEKTAAQELLDRVKSLKLVAETLMERVNKTRERVTDVDDRLKDLQEKSKSAGKETEDTKLINLENRDKIAALKQRIADLQKAQEDVVALLAMATKMLEDSRKYLADGRTAFRDIERESTRLDQAVETLNNFLDRITKDNDGLRPLVDNATEHARKLKADADRLQGLIADTNKLSENALNAASAYTSIVNSIDAARNASEEAIDKAMTAQNMSAGKNDEANEALVKSQHLLRQAQDLKDKVSAGGELSDRLQNAIDATDDVIDMNTRTEEGLTDLTLGLGMLPQDGGLGKAASEAAMKAMDAQQKADAAKSKVQGIINKLPEDKKKLEQIPEDIRAAETAILTAQTQVNQVLTLVPAATDLMQDLSKKAASINSVGKALMLNITELRDRIEQARQRANSIRVGMEFYRNTTLSARTPKNLESAGSFTKVSLWVNTTEKNGLMMYVGGDRSTDTVGSMDYMALTLNDGLVSFTFDLGDGATVINSTKRINDNNWHQIIAERTGKSGSLTIKTDKQNDSVTAGRAPGQNSVLELDPKTTKIYLGGVPETAELPSEIKHRDFKGSMETVTFNNVPIGLWNFVEGSKENTRGSLPRPEIVTASTFHKFDGTGYVDLPRERFNPNRETLIVMDFKTFAQNGLMFYADSPQKDYMAVELVNGKIRFQFDLGSGPLVLTTEKMYNDGKKHTLTAERYRKDGQLMIDNDESSKQAGASPGGTSELGIRQNFWIGGHKGFLTKPGIVSQSFKGCLGNLALNRIVRNLKQNNQIKGVVDGCIQEVLRIASFSADQPGYVAFDPVNVNTKFETTFKIKTTETTGQILYAANEKQTNFFSISLVDGKVEVLSNAGNQLTKLTTGETYNDGRWHYFTVTKDRLKLLIDIDDKYENMETASGSKRRVKTTTPLYFGGVPSEMGKFEPFAGCIGDITVNGNILNFDLVPPLRRGNVSLAGCPIPDPVETTTAIVIPTLPGRPEDLNGVTSTPLSPDTCALPLNPTVTPQTGENIGQRFGTQPYSREEYNKLPSNIKLRMRFEVDIKTTSSNGVIFYVADDRHTDNVALYMKNGKVVFGFNCGSGGALLTSTKTYNDDQWHKIVFSRDQKDGELSIDGQLVKTGKSAGNAANINVTPPNFVGGLDKESATRAAKNLEGITESFMGCIRDFKLNGEDFGPPAKSFSVLSCSDEVEGGTYIPADGGYLILTENFKVGLDVDVYFEIRPRSLSGILMSVTSQRGDYFIIQMVDGELIVSVNNGAGEIFSTYTPPSPHTNTLCNGEWHTVQVAKAKNLIALRVDGILLKPTFGAAGVSSTDTNDPLYIGGLPDNHQAKGVRTSEQYVGCIRGLKINKKAENLAASETFGKVDLNSCPKN